MAIGRGFDPQRTQRLARPSFGGPAAVPTVTGGVAEAPGASFGGISPATQVAAPSFAFAAQPRTGAGLGLAAQASGLGGQQTGVLTPALAGAAAGSALGPVGIGIGAGVGTLGGIASIRAGRKRRQAAAEQRKQENIARIEQQRGQQTQAAFGNIISALRSAFLG